jgi:predicted phosphate transport protein (TIGR00153 family)
MQVKLEGGCAGGIRLAYNPLRPGRTGLRQRCRGRASRVLIDSQPQDKEIAMFGRLMPTEGRFFEYFVDLAEHILQASRELAELMTNFDDVERRAYNIETIEKNGDKITHAAVEMLHKTFITPIDREDIHQLITNMDDILDLIEDSAQSVFLYDIRSVTPEAKKLADICVNCAEQVKVAVGMLSNMDNARSIMTTCGEIDKLESEADHVMRSAMAKLFRDEPDTRQLIKLRSVYELLEAITDRCEDVANIIEGIVLENS